jgi:hypothetical protein
MSTSTGKSILTLVIAVVIAFGAGYLTAYLAARQNASNLESSVADAESATQQAREELREANLKLEMADLSGKLGLVYIDVNQNNFGMAADKVTPFFDGLAGFLESQPGLPDQQIQGLREVLARRDEIVSDLARANPDVRDKIGEVFSFLHAQLN